MPWTDKYENAYECWNRLVNTYNFTQESAAAIIGNFQSEGLLNPAQWQIGSTIGDWYNDNVGLGLGQWTPPHKLGDYCGGNTESAISDGDKQIDFTVTNTGQWVQRVNARGYSTYYGAGGIPYITSIAQFGQSHLMPEDLATCWCACWEGCSRSEFRRTYNTRRDRARYWYDEFAGSQSDYHVYITSSGDGVATATPNHAPDGTSILLECIPNGSEQLLLIDARTPQGYSFALYQQQVQTFIMPQYDLFIDVQFSGSTPTPPTPPPYSERKKMPLWMMLMQKRKSYIMENM